MYNPKEIIPKEPVGAKCYTFYLITIEDQTEKVLVSSYLGYEKAKKARIQSMDEFGKDEFGKNYTYLIAAELRFGNNLPVIVGYDTNVDPFKQKYQDLKDSLRVDIIKEKNPYNQEGYAFEHGAVSVASHILRDNMEKIPSVMNHVQLIKATRILDAEEKVYDEVVKKINNDISKEEGGWDCFPNEVMISLKETLLDAIVKLLDKPNIMRTQKEKNLVSFLNSLLWDMEITDLEAIRAIAENINIYRY